MRKCLHDGRGGARPLHLLLALLPSPFVSSIPVSRIATHQVLCLFAAVVVIKLRNGPTLDATLSDILALGKVWRVAEGGGWQGMAVVSR